MGQQEDLTRALASALWRTAASPYCSALDNWLAAEAMAAEALRAAAAAAEGEAKAALEPAGSLPSSAFPVTLVRDLAQCFWAHSARSAASTLDIWLSAERHVLALCRAALAGHGDLRPLSAEAYWQRIRDQAEWLWHLRGRPQERDLDTWLEAEAEVLAQTAAGRGAGAAPARTESVRERRPLALTELEEDRREHGSAFPWCPPVRPEQQGAQLPL